MRNAACRDRADAASGDRFAALDDQQSAVEREAAHPWRAVEVSGQRDQVTVLCVIVCTFAVARET